MTTYMGKIAGNLVLSKDDDAKQVTSIGGSLYVRPNAQADLPALTSIGGYLYVSDGAQADLPALTSIGGYPVPEAEIARQRLKAVAQKVIADPALLNMGVWHSESSGCGTTHCIAGWAVHLEPGGYDLESRVGSTLTAGNILLGPEASKLFFLDKDKALHELRKVLEVEPSA